MKSKDLSELLKAFGVYLDATGAGRAATALAQVADLFSLQSNKNAGDVLKTLEAVPASHSLISEDLSLCARAVAASAGLVRLVGKASSVADMAALGEFLSSRADWSAPPFFEAAKELLTQAPLSSKSKTGKAKGAKPFRQDLVDKYLRSLEQSLGDDAGFRVVVAMLEQDKELGVPEIVAVAKSFSLASVKSRATALKKIMGRHAALMTSRARSAATSGRIAG